MKNLLAATLFAGVSLVFASCGENHDGHANNSSGAAETDLVVADPSATSLVKRGMVVVQDTPRKLHGPESKKDVIYRFYPFDNDQQHLRLTTAGNNAGKGIAEEQEIDLAPYANRMIEVQGSSFTNRWVFNAKINGVVVTDTTKKATARSDAATE